MRDHMGNSLSSSVYGQNQASVTSLTNRVDPMWIIPDFEANIRVEEFASTLVWDITVK